MRTLTFLLCLLLLSPGLFSQPQKRSLLINLSGTAAYQNQSQEKQFSVTLQPKAGLFLSPYFCLGIQNGLGYGHEKSMNSIPGETAMYWFNTNAYVFELGPFFRIYYPARRNTAFVHGAFLYQYVNEKTTTDYHNLGNNVLTHGTSLQLGIGYAYFITPNISIELLPVYQWTFSKTTVTGELLPSSGVESGKSRSGKLSATLGIQFYLNRQSKKQK